MFTEYSGKFVTNRELERIERIFYKRNRSGTMVRVWDRESYEMTREQLVLSRKAWNTSCLEASKEFEFEHDDKKFGEAMRMLAVICS